MTTPNRMLCALFFFLWAQTLPLAHAQVEPSSAPTAPSFQQDTWHLSISPYLWLAGLDGNVNVLGQQASVHQSFGDILGNLKFGVMGLAEVRRGRLGILTDLLYIRIGDQKAIAIPIVPGALPIKLTSNTFTLTPLLAYRVYERGRLRADLLGGVRYYHVDARIQANAGALGQPTVSRGANWADAVGGARLGLQLSDKAGVFLIGDAGGGGSSPAWQLATGIGYRVAKNATAQFGYRHLYFDRGGDSKFGFDATEEGFILGLTMRLR